MRLGCSTIHYQFTGWPLEVALENISSMGYEGMEINFGKNCFGVNMRPEIKEFLREEDKFRQVFKKLNLELASLCVMSSWNGSQKDINEAEETLTDAVEIAGRFGVDRIVLVSGPIAPDLSRQAAWQQVIDNLKWAADITDKNGIKMLIEGVATWVIDNTEAFLKAKDQVGKNFYANIDPSNYYQAGDDPIDVVKKLEDCVMGVHLKDAKTQKGKGSVAVATGYAPMGEGDIDFILFLQTLKSIGYDGWLQAEYEGFFGGYNPDPVKGSQDTYDFIKPILAKL